MGLHAAWVSKLAPDVLTVPLDGAVVRVEHRVIHATCARLHRLLVVVQALVARVIAHDNTTHSILRRTRSGADHKVTKSCNALVMRGDTGSEHAPTPNAKTAVWRLNVHIWIEDCVEKVSDAR